MATNEDYVKSLMGKKLLIVGKHPHKDMVGVVIGVDDTNVGKGIKVRLTDGIECYVFRAENVRWL